MITITEIEINKSLKPAGVDTLMKPTSVIHVHDTEAHITYKVNVETLAKAVARRLVTDGLLALNDD